MLTRIRHILEMIRFSHTLFALPFALLATLLACRLLGAEAALKQGVVQQADATHAGVTRVSVIRNPSMTELRRLVHEFPAVRQPVFVWPWGAHHWRFGVHGRRAQRGHGVQSAGGSKIDALNPRTANRHLPTVCTERR